MRWWLKALVAGSLVAAGSVFVGYLVASLIPALEWEVTAIFVSALCGLAFLSGSFVRRVEPTIPPHFANVHSHAEIHSMAWRKEVGNLDAGKWNPDTVITAAPSLITALALTLWVILAS